MTRTLNIVSLLADFSNAVQVTKNSPMCTDIVGVIFWQASLFYSMLFTFKRFNVLSFRHQKSESKQSLNCSFQTKSRNSFFFLSDLHTTLLRLMFGRWARQCGRWHKRSHLFLIPNNLGIAGRHSANQNCILQLFTTFYENVLTPLRPVLTRATCSKYVHPSPLLFFTLLNCALLQHPFIHNACGRPVIVHLLSQCMAIEQLLQETTQ